MNTLELESISEATGNYLIYNAAPEYNFDRIAVKMLASDLPAFLAPVKIMNKFDTCVVKYDTGSYKSISSIKMRMSKKECCTLIYNLLYPIMTCGEWLLDYHKLCFTKDYILCDANTFEVRYIYILENSFSVSDDSIMDTIRSIFRNTDIIDDKDFRIDLLQALLDEDCSVNGLFEMIEDIRKNMNEAVPARAAFTEEHRSNVISAPKQREAAAVPPVRERPAQNDAKNGQTASPVSEPAHSSPIFDEADEDMENLFSSHKKSLKPAKAPKAKTKQKSDIFGGLFGKGKPAKKADEISAPEAADDHTVIIGMSGDDETQIFAAFLQLESSELTDCPPSLPLDIGNGGTVTIGRKSSSSANANADIEFPADCIKISRRHCKIMLENGIYSICDLNSGNGTYIDGQKAEPGVWKEIKNGSRIMFGNNVAVYSLQIN